MTSGGVSQGAELAIAILEGVDGFFNFLRLLSKMRDSTWRFSAPELNIVVCTTVMIQLGILKPSDYIDKFAPYIAILISKFSNLAPYIAILISIVDKFAPYIAILLQYWSNFVRMNRTTMKRHLNSLRNDCFTFHQLIIYEYGAQGSVRRLGLLANLVQ